MLTWIEGFPYCTTISVFYCISSSELVITTKQNFVRHWSQTTGSTGAITWHQPKTNALFHLHGKSLKITSKISHQVWSPQKRVPLKNYPWTIQVNEVPLLTTDITAPSNTEAEDLRCFAAGHWAPTISLGSGCLLGSFKQRRGKHQDQK